MALYDPQNGWIIFNRMSKEDFAKRQAGTIDPDSEFAAWLEWAHQQADRLDPLAESPPSILDEDIEAIEDERRELLRSWNNNY
jgi:hypothetical protein